MKLIFCPYCQDVRKLLRDRVQCSCGKSYGWYKDSLNASIGGDAIPLGIANISLAAALKHRPDKGDGEDFIAFVIPRECRTIEVLSS